jgi:hypothetical protein
VPFSSARKWSGATFDGHGTHLLGVPSVVAGAGMPDEVAGGVRDHEAKNLGLASFCRPAKQNVNPRKAHSGRNARPNRYGADDAGAGLDATRYPPGLRPASDPHG